MKTDIFEIAREYSKEHLKEPHLNCIWASNALFVKLSEAGIKDISIETFIVDMNRYNGKVKMSMKHWEEIEHQCIKVGRKILDVTAAQFNNSNGDSMPNVYFGPRPIWYKDF